MFRGCVAVLPVQGSSYADTVVQVHEKSILLPMLPLSLLAAHEPDLLAWIAPVAAFSMFPLLAKDGVAGAYAAVTPSAFLLLPLLPGCLRAGSCRDLGACQAAALKERPARDRAQRSPVAHSHVRSPLHALAATWREAADAAETAHHSPRFWAVLRGASGLGMATLHVLRAAVQPPAHLPFLHDALMTAFSAAHFGALAVYATLRQVRIADDSESDRPRLFDD